MKNITRAILVTALITSGVFFSGRAQATPIGAGGYVNPVLPGAFTGDLVCSSSHTFDNGVISGTLNSYVYANDPFNMLGGLTFVYQLSSAGPDSISQLSTGFFATFGVDVSQLIDGAVPQPVTDVTRSLDGSILHWEFQVAGPGALGALDPGDNSYYLIAETDATSYQMQLVGVINHETMNVLACVPNVPDGGSAVALLGVALAGIEILRRKLRAA